MHTTLHLKTSLKALALLAGAVLAMLLVIDGQQVQPAQDAPLLLNQASMLLPAFG